MNNHTHTSPDHFGNLMERLRHSPLKRVALVCPDDTHTQYVIERGLQEGIARFSLYGGPGVLPAIERLAEQRAGDVSITRCASPDDAARQAVWAVREGRADVLMKGTINTDNLLRAVLDKEAGLLQPGSVLTHVAIASLPVAPGLIVFTDAAVIPQPTTEQLDAMLRRAVETSRQLGTERPRVALLHCTEKTSPKFPVTLSYGELVRRALQGCYGPVDVGGPMDVRTALDASSARLKRIASPVAGRADVLVFPDIEAANTFYKTITLLGCGPVAGMLCGTVAPVVVASRADSGESKLCSLAVALL